MHRVPTPTLRQRPFRGVTLLVALLLLAAAVPVEGAAQSSAQSSAQSGFRIIVHETNPVESLSRAELSSVFLRKTSHWGNGRPVFPIDLLETSPVREVFTRDVLGKPLRAVKAYWNQMVFSGRSTPPPQKASDQDVVEFVRKNPNAIGYVSASAQLAGVKTIRVR